MSILFDDNDDIPEEEIADDFNLYFIELDEEVLYPLERDDYTGLTEEDEWD